MPFEPKPDDYGEAFKSYQGWVRRRTKGRLLRIERRIVTEGHVRNPSMRQLALLAAVRVELRARGITRDINAGPRMARFPGRR